jgi:hypothetical protein
MLYNNHDLNRRKIYQKVAWLNKLPADEAERVFRECSSSRVWARQMTVLRPFTMLESLYDHARNTWTAARASEAEPWERVEECLGRLLER